jgi:rhodanese-related sulfurtransferase
MEIINFLFAEEQMFTTSLLIALISLFIFSFISDKYKKYKDLNPNEAVNLMDDEGNLVIVDVREEKERKAGFIANDTHIPLGKIKNTIKDLDPAKTYLLYCRSGSRSGHAASMFTKSDFQNVYNLKGGFNAWKRSDLPIKK